MSRARSLWIFGIVALALGCSAGPEFKDLPCNADATQECACDDGALGSQACAKDGSGWGACVCAAMGTAGKAGAVVSGSQAQLPNKALCSMDIECESNHCADGACKSTN